MTELPAVRHAHQSDPRLRRKEILAEGVLGLPQAVGDLAGERVRPAGRQPADVGADGPGQHGADALEHVGDLPAGKDPVRLPATVGAGRPGVQEVLEPQCELAVDLGGPPPAALRRRCLGEVQDRCQPRLVGLRGALPAEPAFVLQEGLGQLPDGQVGHAPVPEPARRGVAAADERPVLDLGEQPPQARGGLGFGGPQRDSERAAVVPPAGQVSAAARPDVDLCAVGGDVGVRSHQDRPDHAPIGLRALRVRFVGPAVHGPAIPPTGERLRAAVPRAGKAARGRPHHPRPPRRADVGAAAAAGLPDRRTRRRPRDRSGESSASTPAAAACKGCPPLGGPLRHPRSASSAVERPPPHRSRSSSAVERPRPR